MKPEYIRITEAIKQIGVSRPTFYSYLKEMGITLHKEGNNSYITTVETEKIKNYITVKRSSKKTKKTSISQYTSELEIIKELKNDLTVKDIKIVELSQELGKWQGRAGTLEEQNKLLLQSKPEPQAPKKPNIWLLIMSFLFCVGGITAGVLYFVGSLTIKAI